LRDIKVVLFQQGNSRPRIHLRISNLAGNQPRFASPADNQSLRDSASAPDRIVFSTVLSDVFCRHCQLLKHIRPTIAVAAVIHFKAIIIII
jgi:hypothetical protein